MKWFLAVAFSLMAIASNGQEISFPELFSVLQMKPNEVDTLMKKKGYKLLQRETDSVSSLVYYSSLERNEEAPSWVRSFTLMDASVNNLSSRMILYRTYNKDEYRKLMEYLLLNNYKTSNTFDFKESKHTVYENGKTSIRVKIADNKLKNGRIVKSYEIEMGR